MFARYIATIVTTLFCLLHLNIGYAALTNNADGTVTDTATGLVWDQCTWGQGPSCVDIARFFKWKDALAIASTANTNKHKGYSDWRLPNQKELFSLLNVSATSMPLIDTSAFPNTVGDLYWTSTTYQQTPSAAWYLSFGSGISGTTSKINTSAYIRLVRGGQGSSSFDALAPSSPPTPPARFTINAGGDTVTDSQTGLTWKRCLEGQVLSDSSCTGDIGSYSWQTAMSLGTNGFGLPTLDQLKALYDPAFYSLGGPAINTNFFSSKAWSSWSSTESGADAYYLQFQGNNVDNAVRLHGKQNKIPVLLVKNGATAALVTLTGVTLSCPAQLSAQEKGTCTGTASYSNGTTKTFKMGDVLPNINTYWSISNNVALWSSDNGTAVAAQAVQNDTKVTVSVDYKDNGILKIASADILVKGQALLNDLLVFCPSTIEGGKTGKCTAQAVYTNGVQKSVTPVWSKGTVPDISIDASGEIKTSAVFGTSRTGQISATYQEGSIAKTGVSTITIVPTVKMLGSLKLSCSKDKLRPEEEFTCSSSAYYTNLDSLFSDSVEAKLSFSPPALTVKGFAAEKHTLIASKVAVDTPVAITATYTLGGVTATASFNVLIQTTKVSGLQIGCPSSIKSKENGNCAATVHYSNDTDKIVKPNWRSSNTSVLSINSEGFMSSESVDVDTIVEITATYTENGITHTQKANITVLKAPKFQIEINCPSSIQSKENKTCSATAIYPDGVRKSINAVWSSSNPSLLPISSNGSMTAAQTSTSAMVVITGTYTEGGVTQTKTTNIQVSPVAATPLTAPTLSVSPSISDIKIGSTVTLSVSTVSGAEMYQICWGSQSKVYEGCANVTTQRQLDFPLTDEISKLYIAAKVSNPQAESAYSNEINFLSKAVDAIIFPNKDSGIIKNSQNIIKWNKFNLDSETVSIYVLNDSSVGISDAAPVFSKIQEKRLNELAKSIPNTGEFSFVYTGKKIRPRIVVIGSDGKWSISAPSVYQTDTQQQLTFRKKDYLVELAADKVHYSLNESPRFSIRSLKNVISNDVFDFEFTVGRDDILFYFDGNKFSSAKNSLAKDIQFPEILDRINGINIPINWSDLGGAGKYKFAVSIRNKQGKVVASDYVWLIHYVGSVSQPRLSPKLFENTYKIAPRYQPKSTTQNISNWVRGKVETLGEGAEWAYRTYKATEKIIPVVELVSDYQEMSSNYEDWKTELPSDYADNLLAISMILKLFDYTSVGGAYSQVLPTDLLLHGIKQMYSYKQKNELAWNRVTWGRTFKAKAALNDCWWNCPNIDINFYLYPMQTEQGVVDVTSNPDSIFDLSNTRKHENPEERQPLLPDATKNDSATFVVTYRGLYLLEARRKDNNAVVHRQTVLIGDSTIGSNTETISISEEAFDDTKNNKKIDLFLPTSSQLEKFKN